MFDVEAVRQAALSDKPWKRLDDLVRREIVAGRSIRQIYDALLAMADVVEATPGLSADGEDAIGDTLDKLIGNCWSDDRYIDPPAASPVRPPSPESAVPAPARPG